MSSRGSPPKSWQRISKVWSSINDPLGVFSGTNNVQGIGVMGEGGLMGLGDMFGITTPAEEVVTPLPAEKVYTTAAEEAAAKSRREFLAKQALLSSKNSTIKTNTLGQPADSLQTSRKTLLGG
jgi:hypothetical protein